MSLMSLKTIRPRPYLLEILGHDMIHFCIVQCQPLEICDRSNVVAAFWQAHAEAVFGGCQINISQLLSLPLPHMVQTAHRVASAWYLRLAMCLGPMRANLQDHSGISKYGGDIHKPQPCT